MANLTLNTKVYVGSGLINGIANWRNLAAGVAAGIARVTASIRFDSKTRLQWKLAVPVVATTESACACPGEPLRIADAVINIRMDPGATSAERTDFALQLKDLVASTDFQSSIISLAQPAG